ncbi:TlpA family protein disulfide reductase [Longimonas halophila]|nr:TlpA disulfide reductase family protein [Longimonas halophila]
MGGCGGDTSDRIDPAEAPRISAPSDTAQGYPSIDESALNDPFPAPDLTLTTLEGEEIALRNTEGPVVLNFWATWCPPCRKEIPDLIDLQNEYGDRGLTLVGVSRDQEGESVVTPFVEDMEINYPIVVEKDNQLEETLGTVYALPTTVLISPEGQVTHSVMGLFDVDSLRDQLDAWIDAEEAVADRS